MLRFFTAILGLCWTVLGLFATPAQAQTLPAFPGASGFGSQTPGGRFGTTLVVSNLNDTEDTSSPEYQGSLRWALESPIADDPSDPYDQRRTIVFAVGGQIQAVAGLEVLHPFTTIAGQSAPEPGIVITGAPLSVESHDVIVRGLKLRVGDQAGSDLGNRDGIKVSYTGQPVYNVIIDRNSIAWAVDESGSVWNNGGTAADLRDITFSYNIFAEALNCGPHPETNQNTCLNSAKYDTHHSMGFITDEASRNVALHHNLFASNNDRNALLRTQTSVFANNVVYNWFSGPFKISGMSGDQLQAEILSNYFKPTEHTLVRQGQKQGIYLKCDIPESSQVYVNGNLGAARTSQSQDDWAEVVLEECGDRDLASVRAQSSVVASHGLEVESADQAYQTVLAQAGAPAPDELDQRILESATTGTPPAPAIDPDLWLVNTPEEVGWPTYASTAGPTDTDQDGLPDTWESAQQLDPSNPSDARQSATSGYSHLEEYLNSLFEEPPAPQPTLCQRADFNNDQEIDLYDYALFVSVYQSEDDQTSIDLNQDGTLNLLDYAFFVKAYQEC